METKFPTFVLGFFDLIHCFRSSVTLKKRGGGGNTFFSGGNVICQIPTWRYLDRYLQVPVCTYLLLLSCRITVAACLVATLPGMTPPPCPDINPFGGTIPSNGATSTRTVLYTVAVQ